MRTSNLVRLFAAIVALTAAPAFAADHQVQVGPSGSFTFSPSSLIIASGDTITFVNANNGGFFHNAVSDDGGATFSSGAVKQGPWMFTTAPLTASIAYHCTNHGTAGTVVGVAGTGMAGSITVQAVPVRLQSFDVD